MIVSIYWSGGKELEKSRGKTRVGNNKPGVRIIYRNDQSCVIATDGLQILL
jgi:hypothetical protein